MKLAKILSLLLFLIHNNVCLKSVASAGFRASAQLLYSALTNFGPQLQLGLRYQLWQQCQLSTLSTF